MNEAVLCIQTPIGQIVLKGTDDAVTQLQLPNAQSPTSADCGKSAALRSAARQLSEYFAGKRQMFDLPLQPVGTPFQREVWSALQEIPYGQTISYGTLSAMTGRPRAYRAVGQANGANPLAIVIPCHRVLASGGKIGGYGGGLDVKRQLLALEGVASI